MKERKDKRMSGLVQAGELLWHIHHYPINSPHPEVDHLKFHWMSDQCLLCQQRGVPPSVIFFGEDTTFNGKYNYSVFICTDCIAAGGGKFHKPTVSKELQKFQNNIMHKRDELGLPR